MQSSILSHTSNGELKEKRQFRNRSKELTMKVWSLFVRDFVLINPSTLPSKSEHLSRILHLLGLNV